MFLGNVAVLKLCEPDLREHLEKYLSTGNYLREEVKYISNNIQHEMMRETTFTRLYYFVAASSGMGKSQLAASLSSPVVYIPWTHSQYFYRCFDCVYIEVRKAIEEDRKFIWQLLADVDPATYSMRFEKLSTVGLLVALFREVSGMTNEESLRLLSGYDGEKILQYRPMSIDEAQITIREIVTASNNNQNMAPIFFIDEVPSDKPKDDSISNYLECVYLRNIIRCMRCICVMSGTEVALINAIDKISEGSRKEGEIEYLRIIVELPRTNWDAFCNDSRYADLMPHLSPDVCDMLKLTRPLFVQYVLDAMLALARNDKSYKIGELTAMVLSTVKTEVVNNKTNFATIAGLFGQTALVYSKLVSSTADQLRSKKKEDLKFLEDQRQSLVRHHFGRMRVENSISSLYLGSSHIYSKKKEGEFSSKFSPNFDFESPCNDPLLYLICIRDGFYGTNENDKIVRFSSSYALKIIFTGSHSLFSHVFANTNKKLYSGNFLEMETMTAMIVSSHSHASLSGCPLNVFLGSVVAELNPFEDYVKYGTVKGTPRRYRNVKIGLLSPANLTWRDNKERYILQNASIVLGACDRSSNHLRSDITFPAFVEVNSTLMASVEVNCYEGHIPNVKNLNTFENIVRNDHLVTIMVVTKFGSIRETNQKLKDASDKVNVAVIRGNALENQPVATELTWKYLAVNENNMTVNARIQTVILIDLESIYKNRHECLNACYHPK